MDDKRAKTLQALSAFIDSQRALLSRTHSDVDRLKQIKGNLCLASEITPRVLSEQLDQGVFQLCDQNDLAASIVKEIDWSLYKSQDPTAIQELASEIQRARSERTQPSKFQHSELSDLQKLVRQSRRSIVDPILSRLASDPQYIISSDEDEPMDPEQLRRELEREKIRELKRKITCGLTVPVQRGSRRAQSPGGVFIRRDQDESADVDVTLDEGTNTMNETTNAMDVDPPPGPIANDPPPISKPTRERRQSRKVTEQICRTPKPGKEIKPKPPEANEEGGPSKSKKDRGPKSDTYKLAWTVEEQRLLERLLEEIPDGERNRWAKISQAMNGRRTARQVASRVQKYFEKLRKFGVDIDANGTKPE